MADLPLQENLKAAVLALHSPASTQAQRKQAEVRRTKPIACRPPCSSCTRGPSSMLLAYRSGSCISRSLMRAGEQPSVSWQMGSMHKMSRSQHRKL